MSRQGWTQRAREMKTKLDELSTSEMTQEQFAKSEGMGLSTLVYWKRRIRDLEQGKQPQQNSSPFVPVHVVDATAKPSYEIETKQGHKLRISKGFDLAELRQLLQVLESC